MPSNRKKGFIGTTIAIIITLAVLSFIYGWNIIDLIQSDIVQNIWSYIVKFFKIIWSEYLSSPVMYVWDNVVIGFIWKWTVIISQKLSIWIDMKS